MTEGQPGPAQSRRQHPPLAVAVGQPPPSDHRHGHTDADRRQQGPDLDQVEVEAGFDQRADGGQTPGS